MQFDHRTEGRLAKYLHPYCVCTMAAAEITGTYLKNKSSHWTHDLHQHPQAPNLLLVEFLAKQQAIENKLEEAVLSKHTAGPFAPRSQLLTPSLLFNEGKRGKECGRILPTANLQNLRFTYDFFKQWVGNSACKLRSKLI